MYVFKWLYFTYCLTSFSPQSLSWPLCSVFDSISSNIHEVLSMNLMYLCVCLCMVWRSSPYNSGLQGLPLRPFKIILCKRSEPLFNSQLPSMAIPLFIFFPNLSLLQDSSNKIASMRYQVNTKINSHGKVIFFIFRGLKNYIKCSFISSAFISNTRQRFNPK